MTAFDAFNTHLLPPGFDDIQAQELDAIDAIRRCGTIAYARESSYGESWGDDWFGGWDKARREHYARLKERRHIDRRYSWKNQDFTAKQKPRLNPTAKQKPRMPALQIHSDTDKTTQFAVDCDSEILQRLGRLGSQASNGEYYGLIRHDGINTPAMDQGYEISTGSRCELEKRVKDMFNEHFNKVAQANRGSVIEWRITPELRVIKRIVGGVTTYYAAARARLVFIKP